MRFKDKQHESGSQRHDAYGKPLQPGYDDDQGRAGEQLEQNQSISH